MHLALKEDSAQALARHEAFWHREIIDRPPVMFHLRKPGTPPFRAKAYASYAERWLDLEYRAEQIDYDLTHTDHLYDALPTVFPNLGPEIFSAWCGCGYDYSESTTWAIPCMEGDEPQGPTPRLDIHHPLFRALERFTDLLIERGRGRFIVGLTDLHPGGDHLAALRDPQQLNIDLLDNPEWVERALALSMTRTLKSMSRMSATPG